MNVLPARSPNEELEIARIERVRRRKLKSLCISVIAENIRSIVHDYYLAALKRRNRSQPIEQEFRNSPFEDLPSSVLDELYDECVIMYGNNSPSLLSELFITQNQHKIKYERYSCFWEHESRLFSLIKYKSQNLRQLILANCKIDVMVINDLLKGLKNLHLLDLSGTNAGKHTLEIISSTMNSMRELNLSRLSETKRVNESGIKCLCERKLENLRILKLQKTPLSPTTLCELLQFYPELLVLEHETILDALLLLKNYHPKTVTKLSSLNVSVKGQKQLDLFNSVIELCPKLMQFSLCTNFSTNEFKFDTGNLRSITLYTLKPWFSSEFITKISLIEIHYSVDLTDLLLSFPNMRDLSLTHCILEFTPDKYNVESVKKIKTFYIERCMVVANSMTIIKDIFYSENLETLTILDSTKDPFRCVVTIPFRSTYFKSLTTDSFHTDLLQQIIQYNRNLESINISLPFYDNFAWNLNFYFKELLEGKARLFSVPSRRMQRFLYIYNRHIR